MMKKIILAGVISFFAADAFSQVSIGVGGGGMGMGVHIPLNKKKQRMQNIENKVQQMRSDLDLDSAQTVKVRGLLVERERKKSKGNPMSRYEFNNRMDEILTDEQRKKFKELHRQKRQSDKPKPEQEKKDSTVTKQEAPETDWDDVYK